MSEKQNLDTLMSVIADFNNNDIASITDGTHPEVTYIVRGRSTLSGTYTGRISLTVGAAVVTSVRVGI